jgi:hypothetical protein
MCAAVYVLYQKLCILPVIIMDSKQINKWVVTMLMAIAPKQQPMAAIAAMGPRAILGVLRQPGLLILIFNHNNLCLN